MNITEKVKELIAKQLGKAVDQITEDKEVVTDLGADSLDVVEMLMTMEEEFGVAIPEDEAVNIKTVGDIIKLLEDKN